MSQEELRGVEEGAAALKELQEKPDDPADLAKLPALRLADMEARRRLETLLDQSTPSTVAGADVLEVISTDGIKLRMGPNHWLMLRFSGTEPLLRLYCEGPDAERVNEVLAWARQFAEAA